jgi:tRNA threonylcarbamoyladenosine biosynthesis protein TsaB
MAMPSLKILAFDTSLSYCSVALAVDDTHYTSHQYAPMQQSHLILPTIKDILKQAQLSLYDLDAIAYGCGPGSFTGIRIANSVAQGLGFAAHLPIIPVSTLQAMAQSAYLEKQWPEVMVAVDARMEQIYWACYEVDANGLAMLQVEESVCSPQQILLPLTRFSYAIGDGWQRYQKQLIAALGFTPLGIDNEQMPVAQAILTIAKTRFQQNNWVMPQEAIPNYLR